MNKKMDTVAYSIMQASMWSFYAILIGFFNNILKNLNFPDSKISLILGSTAALSCLLQFLIVEIIGRWEKVSIHKVLLGMGILMLGGSFMMLNPWSRVFSVSGIFLACVILQSLPAMVNSVAVNAMEHGATTNYSISRGFGSLAYSLSAFITGRFIMMFNINAIPILSATVSIFFIFSVKWYYSEIKQIAFSEKKKTFSEKRKENFSKKHPCYLFFLLGCIFLSVSHNLVCNFMMQIITAKGGTVMQQGISTAIAAFTELPVMFGFSLLLRWMKCEKWVQLSAIFFVIKTLGLYFACTIAGVYLAQMTQLGGFAVFSIASVYYTKEAIGEGDSIRAQSYLAATSTIGGLFASYTGGILCQYFGAQKMILMAFAFASLGAIIGVISVELQKTEKGMSCNK